MKILILGADGYIGYPLMKRLLAEGHEVTGVDNYQRRHFVEGIKSESLVPIDDNIRPSIWSRDIVEHAGWLRGYVDDIQPDAIVHLAEQASAPYSMRGIDEALITQENNVLGTLILLHLIKEVCPTAHLVKLGSMGEYGTPDCDIPEGRIPDSCISIYGTGFKDVEDTVHSCSMSGLLFPRQANSWYHLSKVHDTYNIEFACRNWGLSSTDIMQGVVYGVTDRSTGTVTRFDYDEYFGTVINRFCVQAISGNPITPYGSGEQVRGFLPLMESLECIILAIKNPPKPGEYRTFNQFGYCYSINHLAVNVYQLAQTLNLQPEIKGIENPRNEATNHYYNPDRDKLIDLGYEPTANLKMELRLLLEDILPYKDRVKPEVLIPKTKWNGTEERSKFLTANGRPMKDAK